jgi:parallel beta-helix repeat protein
MTASAIASIISSYFNESAGASDIAIRNNTIVGTNSVPKLYQTSVDGTNYYPSRNASIAMFADISSTYDGIWNEVTGIYPSFQDIEISGNTIQSATGTGIYLTGTRNDHIDNDQFTGCAAVPDADPIYSYFGSESRSALVLSFADNVLATGDVASGNPICTARTDSASSRNVVVGQ